MELGTERIKELIEGTLEDLDTLSGKPRKRLIEEGKPHNGNPPTMIELRFRPFAENLSEIMKRGKLIAELSKDDKQALTLFYPIVTLASMLLRQKIESDPMYDPNWQENHGHPFHHTILKDVVLGLELLEQALRGLVLKMSAA